MPDSATATAILLRAGGVRVPVVSNKKSGCRLRGTRLVQPWFVAPRYREAVLVGAGFVGDTGGVAVDVASSATSMLSRMYSGMFAASP